MTDTTVLIADDHAPTRSAIRSALDGHGFRVAAECPDGDSAVEAAAQVRPDVCLLDIRMPGGGIAAAGRIAAAFPDTAIVMLTVSHDESDFFDALRVGAAGYLLKDTDPEQLPTLLRKVIDGEGVLSPVLVARLMEEFRERGRRRRITFRGGKPVELTSREAEVLDLLQQGLSTADIAQRLFIAPVTVRTHVSAILRKLQLRDRDALVDRDTQEADRTEDLFHS